MRSFTVASLVAVVLSTSSVALAKGPAKKSSNDESPAPVLVADARDVEAPPPVPTPEPPAAPAPAVAPSDMPPTKDAPAASAPSVEATAGPSFVLAFGGGVSVVGGSIAEDIGLGGLLTTLDVKAGAYFTPRFGVLAGVQAGYGLLWEGCSETCLNAVHYQFPVVAQYAFEDRRRGVYVEGGFGFVSTYLASTDSSKQPDVPTETLSLSTPFDFKLGVGYRIPGPSQDGKPATNAVDIRLGIDFGKFRSLEYKSIVGEVEGDIRSERQATHFNIGLNAVYHFAP